MNYWIEVASGDFSIEPKISGEKGLHAPNTLRYRNMLKNIRPGDKVLHYLTYSLTSKKWQSSFVAKSSVASKMEMGDSRLIVKLNDVKLINNSVKLRELKECHGLSDNMQRAMKMSMQAYLFEIEKEDFDLIIELSES